MPSALDHYRTLQPEAALRNARTPEASLDVVRNAFNAVQHLVLSEIPDSLTRQVGSILFAHNYRLFDAFHTVEIVAPPPVVPKPKRGARLVLMIAGLLTLIGSGVLAFVSEDYPALSGMVASLALCTTGVFLPRENEAPTVEPPHLVLNASALNQLAENCMHAIDRDLEAFERIPKDESETDDDVVALLVRMVELKREFPMEISDDLMTMASAIMMRRGFTMIEYQPDVAALFDLMPTRRTPRTIAPALMQGDKLICRGLAVVPEGELLPPDTNEVERSSTCVI